MTEQEFSRKIVQALDGGLDLPAGVSARLATARARAVESQRRVEPSPVLLVVDAIASHLTGPSQWFMHVVLPAMLLVGGLVSLNHWQDSRQRAAAIAEAADLDARLLKGDLPIDAYLDNGFQAWLKRSSD